MRKRVKRTCHTRARLASGSASTRHVTQSHVTHGHAARPPLKVWVTAVFLVIFMLILAPCHADETNIQKDRPWSTEVTGSAKSEYDACHLTYPGTPMLGVFRGIKKIALYVFVPPSYDFEKYPAALKRGKIVETFSKDVRKNVLPFVVPDKDCKVPDLIVLDQDDVDKIDAIVFQPGTLTVVVALQIETNSTPHIAFLHQSLFRPDIHPSERWLDAVGRFAFPIFLNSSDKEIEERVISQTLVGIQEDVMP